MSTILSKISDKYKRAQPEFMSLGEYLEKCRTDPGCYITAAERMLKAIGEPIKVDTSKDSRLGRIFLNRVIKQYPAFKDFFGAETAIENVVSFFRHAAQGLEEKKQVLYLLGPVGGGKSSLSERLKELMEQEPIYVLCTHDGKLSPVNELPLGLLKSDADAVSSEYGIPIRYFNQIPSPWAVKRLNEAQGNIESAFKVAKVYPSALSELGVVKVEPSDENNQDTSTLIGKTNIRMLEKFDQDDTDSYAYSGGLCKGNQGILEFVEMFKAPIKTLHPLLTATQEGNYKGVEAIGAIPFNGVILAHSNESEWQTFRNNKNNEAFLDRIYIVKVPYCLRVDEEVMIYKKMIEASDLRNAPCAPETLKMAAQFAVLTRLIDHENSSQLSKMRVYNGENIRDQDPKAKSIQEYRDAAGIDEGMTGVSTRFQFKVLSKVFNYDPEEVAADPIHLMVVLEDAIEREQFGDDRGERFRNFLHETLIPRYAEELGGHIQRAYLESYSDYGQNIFDRYIDYADAWIQDQEFRDPDTGAIYDRAALNTELEKIEKPAGIANPKDFRNEVVNFVLRARGRPGANGKNPLWTSYEKLREVIEKKMFAATEELLPVISFNAKATNEDQKKHTDFVKRMETRGYTARQVRRLVEWYLRVKKSS